MESKCRLQLERLQPGESHAEGFAEIYLIIASYPLSLEFSLSGELLERLATCGGSFWRLVSLLVPFLEHRRGAVLPVPAPRTMSTMSPSPARTPEEEAEGPHCREEEEEQDQEAEEAK